MVRCAEFWQSTKARDYKPAKFGFFRRLVEHALAQDIIADDDWEPAVWVTWVTVRNDP